MDTFLKMDIFFSVTTLAVVVLTIVLVVVAIRVLAILKKLESIVDLVHESGEQLQEDLEEVRAHIRAGGSRLGRFFGLLGGVTRKKRSRTPSKA